MSLVRGVVTAYLVKRKRILFPCKEETSKLDTLHREINIRVDQKC